MSVLAHFGHWYHVILYLLPVVVVGGGLYVAGRKMPADDELEEFDDGFDDELGGGSRDRLADV